MGMSILAPYKHFIQNGYRDEVYISKHFGTVFQSNWLDEPILRNVISVFLQKSKTTSNITKMTSDISKNDPIMPMSQ